MSEVEVKVTVGGKVIRVAYWNQARVILGEHYDFTITVAEWPAYRDAIDGASSHYETLIDEGG